MKKFFSILTVAAVTLLAVVSCQKKEEAHVPGAPDVEGCYGIYFPVQGATGYHIYDPTQDLTATFTVARTNTKGAISAVPIQVASSDENLFQIGAISFADGQKETTFTVDFPNAEEGKEYKLQIEVTDPQYASIYNASTTFMDFSFMQVKMEDFLNPKTGEPAVITLNEGWWNEVHKAQMRFYEVNGIRTCTIYSIEEGNGIWGDTQDITLEFTWYTKNNNNDGQNFLEVKKQYFGFDYSDWASKPVSEAVNPVFVYDYPWYWVERGYAFGSDGMGADWLAEAIATGQKDGSYPVGYYDGNGGFYFNLRYYIPGVGGFSPDPYEFVAIADGFTRVDYALELAADYPQSGFTPVYVEAGADIASLKYAVYEGELSKIQIEGKLEEIEKDAKAEVFDAFEYDEEEAINYATLNLEAEKTGAYTLVALGLDKDGKVQNSASTVFNFVAEDDAADLAVDVNVFTEDTPARYQNYHNYDSFAYGVSGTDLTEVHVGVFTEETITKNGADVVFEAVKADEKGTYALSADAVAQVNGEGGYYDVLSGLNAKTTYYVVVWATNGTMDSYAFDSYTTDKLPYVWNSLGKGTLTDGFLMPDWSMDDVTVACDVYEEATTPGLYMITGFQLELASAFYEVDSSELLPYEGENGNWWNAEIIVDATDPAAVTIAQQQYGIYTNGTYQYPLIWSVADGTLADGAITFPANGLVVGYTGNGKAYYTNPDGTFKITLPSGAAPTLSTLPAGSSMRTEFTHAASRLYDKAAVKYERDPQPVSVSVEVSYNRKESKKNVKPSLVLRPEYR